MSKKTDATPQDAVMAAIMCNTLLLDAMLAHMPDPGSVKERFMEQSREMIQALERSAETKPKAAAMRVHQLHMLNNLCWPQ